jgi:hypothetical protein
MLGLGYKVWLVRREPFSRNTDLAVQSEKSRERRGEVAEWLMAPVLKTGIPERVSGVRIPPSPPYN